MTTLTATAHLLDLAKAAEANGYDATAAAYRDAAKIVEATAHPHPPQRVVADLHGSVFRRNVPFPGRNEPSIHEIMFVINHGSGPVEVFIHGAPAPYQSVANAIGRLASAALQCGTPVDRIVKTLLGLSDGDWAVRWSEGVVVRSLPDALARALQEWDPDKWVPTKEGNEP